MALKFLKKQKKQKKIGDIEFEERILLISHCLRPSKFCKAKFSSNGLMCLDNCANNCPIGKLRKTAEKLGYKGVCIAPGGRLAIKFIEEKQPEGIIAIACKKELEEGIEAIKHLKEKNKLNGGEPVVTTIPLLKDGCVDTEVNFEEAVKAVRSDNSCIK
ncbi:MAG: DUF116 domain-containing protein [Actinobacteria bacterium]|nr:DUF116 domain-containing protein [Actinomycetota bacterium]